MDEIDTTEEMIIIENINSINDEIRIYEDMINKLKSEIYKEHKKLELIWFKEKLSRDFQIK